VTEAVRTKRKLKMSPSFTNILALVAHLQVLKEAINKDIKKNLILAIQSIIKTAT